MAATLDSDYLRASVGSVLAAGIAETVAEQPDDPVGYLAQFLLKSVADDKASKEVAVLKKEDAVAVEKVQAAAAEAQAKVSEKEAAMVVQLEKEDARLDSLLENSKSSDEVFMAVLSYVRARTGASGYVMLTDLSEKIMPKKLPAPAPAAEGEAAEGEAAEGEAPPEPPPPVEGEGEPPEPRVPFKPTAIEYVAATSSDESLLIGKSLTRPASSEGEEGDDAPPPVSGVGEGVTFTSIDDFVAGGAKVLHVPEAVANRSVKFWYMPRLGAYVCAPFSDYEGDVCGVLGFDTLGLERAFTAAEIGLIEKLAERTGATLLRIEEGLADKHHALMETLTTAYPKGEAGFPAHTPAEGESPIDAAKGALALPAAALAELAALPADSPAAGWEHLETRRKLPEAYLLALKGVLALTSPSVAADMAAATWDGIKEAKQLGELMWFPELFKALSEFDVMAGAGGEGWSVAKQMATELSTAPEEGAPPKEALAADASLLLGKVLCDWLLAACELYTKKVEADEAAAAAAAPPEEGAPPEEAQE